MSTSPATVRPIDATSDALPVTSRTPARASAWCLALGLVGSSATAWRIPGAPFGAGEVALLVWLAYEWSRRGRAALLASWPPAGQTMTPDAIALLCTLATLAAAQLYANVSGYLAWTTQRDFVAILFAAGLSYTLVTLPDRETFSRSMLIGYFWLATTLSSVLLLYAAIPRSAGLAPVVFDPVFGSRFLGLAANPNQYALLMLTLPSCVALAWTSHRGRTRHAALALGCFGSMGGLATQSDALMLTWALLFVGAVGTVAYSRRTATPMPSGPAMVIAGSVLLAFLGWSQMQRLIEVTIPASASAADATGARPSKAVVTTYAQIVAEERRTNPHQVNQVQTRLSLYTNGLRAWSDRPLLGHGVQMVGGLTGPYEKNEAHNTIIDWLTFAGVIGLIPLVAWSWLLVDHAWRRRNVLGVGTLLAIGIFAQFGLYVRHPLFWVVACAFASLPGQLPRPVESK